MSEMVAAARSFKYQNPHNGPHVDDNGQNKMIVTLARTDRMLANVQVLKEGGENNLHSHGHLDGFWMVLKGRVRFYGEGDVLIGEYGAHEGILIPRHFKYWFESIGDEQLELLQVEAFDVAIRSDREILDDRKNHSELKSVNPGKVRIVDGRGPGIQPGR